MQAMVNDGVDTLIEIGPAATLVKFAKKIAPKEVTKYTVTDLASYQKVVEAINAEKG